MPRLSRYGIEVDLPPGWEGAIGRRPDGRADPADAAVAEITGTSPVGAEGSPDEVILPTAHVATVPLPPDRGDFGSGVVERLGPDDAFIGLLEYGPECAGTPAFAGRGVPRRARVADFNRRALQRVIDGQAGWQHFFTDGGRAFCLFVVLGRDHDIQSLVERVNQVLAGLIIEPRR